MQKNAKNAAFFYKERKIMLRTLHSFIKNARMLRSFEKNACSTLQKSPACLQRNPTWVTYLLKCSINSAFRKFAVTNIVYIYSISTVTVLPDNICVDATWIKYRNLYSDSFVEILHLLLMHQVLWVEVSLNPLFKKFSFKFWNNYI